jgi:hypothetical protein
MEAFLAFLKGPVAAAVMQAKGMQVAKGGLRGDVRGMQVDQKR